MPITTGNDGRMMLNRYGAATPNRGAYNNYSLDDYTDLSGLREGNWISDLEQIYDKARACPDCGNYRERYYGPIDFDGVLMQRGDFVCRSCAEVRGVQTHG